ncbi:NADH-quinone oxidoreductase subunit N [Actinoplanes derwentensis]|uniref:NADH-quinone oxidoreductase subunit N n=1 Tax=Actinoplanes derwentensis TaxID=113562 RepID=A0A1H2CM19_9ACTN|nr:proton-conducting transporter membrane subunit [Actinoplanes derwentensis]GID86135.1 NADH-quinone oxidoreductase subunit N [Actinoplanes derwentensis]SDT71481.1 NADH dehydrogenase subunit N [Actinoplanes derwentensis]
MRSQAVDHLALLPLYAAAGTAILALLADLLLARRTATVAATLLGTLAVAVSALAVGPWDSTFCTTGGCSWVPTWPAAVAAALFAALTAGVLGLSIPALRLGAAPAGEFCFLLACSMTGGVTVAYAGDLLTLIVGLETLTLPLYILVGLRRYAPFARPSVRPAEASLTFFLVSVISTAIALLGLALIYVATGAVHLNLLVPAAAPFAALGSVGSALLVIGLAFKVAAVPLHAWAPTTYDGAPIPVAAYLSTASKLGGILALAAVVAHLDTGAVLSALAVLTMTVGNLVALSQTRMVRLLAWSSIAQAGYILAALAMGAPGVPAALSYAVFFVVLELIAFSVVTALRPAKVVAHSAVALASRTPADTDGGTLNDYRGLAHQHRWLGAAMILALSGLAGLPPGLAGLFAKVTVVGALIAEGWTWLAAVVVINAVVALAYYVRVAALLYTYPTQPGLLVADPALLYNVTHPYFPVSRSVTATLLATSAVAVVLGFAPQLLFNAF